MPPEGWRTKSLRALLDADFPGEWGTEPQNGRSNAAVVRSTDLDDDGHLDLSTAARRTIPAAKLAAKRLQGGDLLLEASGGGPGKPVGRVALFRGDAAHPFLCSNFFRTLRPSRSEIDPAFLAWRLQLLYREPGIQRFQQQTTGIINLNTRDYLDVRLTLPDRAEQQRITELLDAVDTTIDYTDALVLKLRRMNHGLLHDLLTRGIDEGGGLRDPHRTPDQFKKSAIGDIPHTWQTGPLARWLAGPPRNGYSPAEAQEPTGWKMLGLGCLTQTGFKPCQLKDAPMADARIKKFVLQDGDLLLSRSNTRELVGLAGVYRDVGVPCTYPDLMMRLVPAATTSSHMLELVLRASTVRRQLQSRASGTSGSMVKVTGAAVAGLQVAIPPLDEQDRILLRLDTAVQRIDAEVKSGRKLRAIKAGLMQDLLSGRVRLPDFVQVAAQ